MIKILSNTNKKLHKFYVVETNSETIVTDNLGAFMPYMKPDSLADFEINTVFHFCEKDKLTADDLKKIKRSASSVETPISIDDMFYYHSPAGIQ